MFVHVFTNKLTILYNLSAFLDLSLKMNVLNVHNAGYMKEQPGKGHNKEDRSYTHLCYHFILWNVYSDFVDIFQNFGLNPYLTTNADEICPHHSLLLCVWCYKTANKKVDIANVSPTFQALTKSTCKALEPLNALKVFHRRDIRVSPLLPATWTVIFNIKTNLGNKFFSSNKFSMFKKGKILPGIVQYTIDNVLMTESMEPPYESVPLQ
jgi:hypothetical protein